jgi:hypothetical protein
MREATMSEMDRVTRAIVLAIVVAACQQDEPARSVMPPQQPALAPKPTGLLVSKSGATIDGASITDDRLLALPQDVGLQFTDDASAQRVLALAKQLYAAGHTRIDFTTNGKVVCSATSAGEVERVPIILEHGEVGVGERPVVAPFVHQTPATASISRDLQAPFFDPKLPVGFGADDAATGAELAHMLSQACPAPRAIVVDVLPRHKAGESSEVFTLPLCRKLVLQSAYDADALSAALPMLWAYDHCYTKFEPHPGRLGTISMAFDVKPDGRLANTRVTGLHADVDSCIAWLLGGVVVPNAHTNIEHVVATMECNMRCCNGD